MMQGIQVGTVGTPRGNASSGQSTGTHEPREWARRTPGVTLELTHEVVRVRAVIEGELGRREIQSVLGLHDENHFREFCQQPLSHWASSR